MTSRFPRILGTVAAAAVLSTGIALAPSFAQTSSTMPPSSAAPSTASAPMSSTAKPSGHMAKAAHRTAPDVVEQRIKDLHAKLHITPSEESAWNAVAQAMRDEASQMNSLITERDQSASSMNAVQDLQSYQKISQAHADGLKGLVSSFQSLYDQMSPTQQKTADAVFGHTQKRASTTTKGG